MNLNRYAKAIVAAVSAAGTTLYAVNADNHVTSNEWVTVAAAFVIALTATWGTPNAKPESNAAAVVARDEPAVVVTE